MIRSNSSDRSILNRWKIALAIVFLPPLFILICAVYNATIGYRGTGNIILPWPSADTIARQYLDNLVRGDTDRLPYLVADYQKYRGVKIGKIQTHSKWESGNSDHHFELTTIEFTYLDRSGVWRSDSVVITTDSNIERGNFIFNNLPFRTIVNIGG